VNPTEVKQMLEKVGALMTGHFKLSSGRHSDAYVQKQRVFEHPRLTQSLGEALASRFGAAHGKQAPFDTVVSPAVGAILLGNAVAHAANVRFLYTERENDRMTLRRGQHLRPGERVLVVEDVITTGGSAAEVVAAAEANGAHVIGVGALVDRSNVTQHFHLEALLKLEVKDWDEAECPLCRAGTPLDAPGSRYIS
jgi:orotate phosphoribosyltransferase